jgi:hypothetical protein
MVGHVKALIVIVIVMVIVMVVSKNVVSKNKDKWIRWSMRVVLSGGQAPIKKGQKWFRVYEVCTVQYLVYTPISQQY